MTDHILKAAKEVGFFLYDLTETHGIKTVESDAADQWAQLERFYTIAYRQGMERAAEICESIADEYEKREGRKYPEMKSDAQTGANDCEYAIRAHAQNQPKTTHDGSVV